MDEEVNNLNIREVRATAKNQAYLSADKSLSLRGRRLSSEDCPPKLLFVEIRPFSSHFTDLDISHSVDCTWNTIEAFLVALTNLQSFTATSCYLVDPEFTPSWPSKLLSLDLSRNKLTNCPGGLESLLQLKYLSLSGNRIHSITAELLRLASLKVLRLTSNPLEYPPKCVVQKGVHAMRKYWNISLLHHPSSSSDPGYSSNEEVAETESDCVFTTMADSNSNSPRFTSSSLPSHYANVHSVEHCEVFVPDTCKASVDIRVSILKDHSYNPPLQSGIFLACPVICVEPHGMQFSSDSPAILVIPHCIDMSNLRHINLTPMCSNTGVRQPPEWTTSKDIAVDVFDNCIMLTTSHFSFFTVVMQHSPPSSTVSILPAAGGVVTVPELPGFKVSLPPHALSGHEHQEIKATISYSTPPCCSVSAADSGSLASVCVGLEPHGTTFVKPVTVCIPIPDFAEISQHFRTHLVLLYSEFRGDDLPLEWQEFKEDVTISNTGMDLYTASFQVSHFSWWKFLWSVPQFFLRPFYRGVVSTYQGFRVMRLSVHCQVLMSPPIPDRTFGLAIAVYKFGDPLQSMANYKWIVADSGQNKRFLKTGPIEIKLTGNFEPIREFEGNDLIKRIDYTGEDFFEEFALKLKDDIVLPLQDHQVLGKLVIREINEDQIRQISLNIIKPVEGVRSASGSTTSSVGGDVFSRLMVDTPPETPEHSIGSPSSDKQSEAGRSSASEQPGPSEWNPSLTSSPHAHSGKKRRHTSSHTAVPQGSLSKRKRRTPLIGMISNDQFILSISRDINNRWQELGIELGLSHSVLQSIPIDQTSGVHMCAYTMLQEWKRMTPEATYQQLKEALERINLHECVHRYFYSDHDASSYNDSSD